jgi:hypothetical protein
VRKRLPVVEKFSDAPRILDNAVEPVVNGYGLTHGQIEYFGESGRPDVDPNRPSQRPTTASARSATERLAQQRSAPAGSIERR